MNKRFKYVLVTLIVISISGFGALVWYTNNNANNVQPDTVIEPTRKLLPTPTLPPKVGGERGIREDKKIEIGSDEVTFAVYSSSDVSFLNYTIGSTNYKMAYTRPDKFVYGCSDQDLEASDNYYLDYVTKIKIIQPSELTNFIKPGTKMIVLATEVDGIFKTYKVVVNSADCTI